MTLPFCASGPSFWTGLKCQTPGCGGKGSHVCFSCDPSVQEVACGDCYRRMTVARLEHEISERQAILNRMRAEQEG